MKSLEERWMDWWDREEAEHATSVAGKSFAIRGDGAIVCFDDDGYFLLIRNGPIQDLRSKILVENPANGERIDVYVEPIWLCGYYETMEAFF